MADTKNLRDILLEDYGITAVVGNSDVAFAGEITLDTIKTKKISLIDSDVDSTKTYKTLVHMLSETSILQDRQLVTLLGGAIEGDGDGGDFYWNSSSTAIHNGTTIIKATNILTGRFLSLNISGSGGDVSSVNEEIGDVVLNQDNILDGTTFKQTHNDYIDADKTKLGHITLTGDIDLDSLAGGSVLSINGETGTVTLDQDNILDGIIFKQTHNDYTSVDKTKLDYISATKSINLNYITTTKSINLDNLPITVNNQTGAVVLNQDNILDGTTFKQTHNDYIDADKTKLGHITLTGDIDLDSLAGGSVLSINGETGTVTLDQDNILDGITFKQTNNNYTNIDKAKINNISVTQPIDLDSLSESGVTSVNAATGAVVLTQDHILDGTTFKQTHNDFTDIDKTKLDQITTTSPINLDNLPITVNNQTGAVVLNQDDIANGTTFKQTHNDYIDTDKDKLDFISVSNAINLDPLSVMASNYVHVDNYGAVGNGVTNDSAAFVSALSSLGITGGQVLINSSKRYRISTSFTVPESCTIVGTHKLVGGTNNWEDSSDGFEIMGSALLIDNTATIHFVNNSGIEGVLIHRYGMNFATEGSEAAFSGTALQVGVKLAQNGNVTNIITGTTPVGNRGIITSADHGLSSGDFVQLDAINGMVDLNGRVYRIIVLTTDTFYIDSDTTGQTYSSGGIWTKYSIGRDVLFKSILVVGFERGIVSLGSPRSKFIDVLGDCINGIEVTGSFDVTMFTRCHFWPFGTMTQSNINSLWANRSGSAYYLHDTVDWGIMTDCFSYGYKNGYNLDSVGSVTLTTCGADGTNSYPGSVGFNLSGYIDKSNIVNCSTAAQGIGIKISAIPNTINTITGFSSWSHFADGAASKHISITGGDVILNSNSFENGHIAIDVSSSTSKVSISGCHFNNLAIEPINNSGGSPYLLISSDNIGVNMQTSRLINSSVPISLVSDGTIVLPTYGDVFTITGANFGQLAGGWEGRRVVLVFGEALTVYHSATPTINEMNLNGDSSLITTANVTLTLVYQGGNWIEEGNVSVSGSGAVDSVNGKIGVVTLNQDNILSGVVNTQLTYTNRIKLDYIANLTNSVNLNEMENDIISNTTHRISVSDPHNVTKLQVGLGNVTDDAQLKTSQLQTVLTNDDTKVPSSGAVFDHVAAQGAGSSTNLTNSPSLNSLEIISSTGTNTTLSAATPTLSGVLTGSGVVNISNNSAHRILLTNPHNVTKAQVGLSNVTDDAQLKTSQLQTVLTNDDTKVPSSGAVFDHVASQGSGIAQAYGNWTPTMKFNGASIGIVYNAWNSGYFAKIGNLVVLSGQLSISAKGTSIGNLTIEGLPYTSINSNGGNTSVSLNVDFITYTGIIQGILLPNSNIINIQQLTELGIKSSLTNSNIANNSYISFNVSYIIA